MANEITLDQAATLCRAFGHAWDPVGGDASKTIKDWAKLRVRAGKGSWDIRVQCHRCTTIRFDMVDSNGELIRRRYTYPEGYKRSRIPRPELRIELKAALRVWGTEEEMELWHG